MRWRRTAEKLEGAGELLPLRPELLDDRATVVYDVTGEPVLDERWRPAEDDEWGTERGPPGEWDGVDAPSPAE